MNPRRRLVRPSVGATQNLELIRAGLEAVIRHYGFKREETAAFGDGMNDLGMIRWAGTGVAMGNAEPEVKAVADYVTTPVWEDGVKNALLHLGILTDGDFQ